MSVSLCLCLSVVNLFSLEHSKHLKPNVSGLSHEFWGCSKGVARMFQGCSKVFKKCSKCVFKDVLRVFQGCFKSVSRVLQGCFMDVSRVFQKYFKGVLRVLKGHFKEISRVIPPPPDVIRVKVFHGSCKEVCKHLSSGFIRVLRMLHSSFQGISFNFQWLFNSVSRKFQGPFR